VSLQHSERPAQPWARKPSRPSRITLESGANIGIFHNTFLLKLASRWTFIIAAICGVTGILITYFFVPDMTGIDLADEDAKFFKYLADNGWEGHVGEDEDHLVTVSTGSDEKLNEKGQ
jgi:hypothetical protein